MLLKGAHDLGKKFRVIVVDSRPQKEGKNSGFFVMRKKKEDLTEISFQERVS
jgi:hypothetical protein